MDNELGNKTNKIKLLLLASGLLITVWSLMTIAGWFLNSQSLIKLVSWSSPIPFDTALMFLLCGQALVAVCFEFFSITKILGLIIALFSSFMLVQEIFNPSWGGAFFQIPFLRYELRFSGGMALNTALCFLLSGVFFLGVKNLTKKKIVPLLLGIVSSLIIAFALLAFVGYLSAMQPAYIWNNQTGMAATTAIGFFLVGLCGVFYNLMLLNKAQNHSFLVSLPFCICILTLTLSFASALWVEQKIALKSAEEAEGNRIKDLVLGGVQHSLNSFEHMVSVWVFNNPSSRQLWEEESKLMLSQQPGLVEVMWVNANNKPAWIVGDSSSLKTEIPLNEKMMEEAKAKKTHTAGGVYDDNGQLIGMSLYFPIFLNNSFDGYMVGLFDIKKFIHNSFLKDSSSNYKISLIHGGSPIISSTETAPPQSSNTLIPINLLGLQLDISVEALEGALGKRVSSLPAIIVFTGLLTTILIAFLFYYALEAKKHIEERENTILQLRRARGTIIEQDRLVSLGLLTAGIAHEVKNPLNIMRCFSDLSQSLVDEISHTLDKYINEFKTEDKDSINESIGTLRVNLVRIGEQSKRANNTIQRMLAHSKGGQQPILTDVHSLLDEYLNLSYYGIRVQDPTLNIKISKRYDVAAPKIYIIAEDMSRVFLNLFNNAYYALAQKKKSFGSEFVPELIITTSNINDQFEIRIRDNGLGIPENLKDKIFTPFFTTKPAGSGTGLGLSLSHAIVAEHGGSLDFVSKEGEFTEFHITLPVNQERPSVSQRELVVKL